MKTELTSAIKVLLAVLLFNASNAQTNTFPFKGADCFGTLSLNTSFPLEIKSTTNDILISLMTKNRHDAAAGRACSFGIFKAIKF